MTEKPSPAREAALAMLSRRALSVFELTEKLLGKGFSDTQAADAVEWLLTLGYLNDEDYARELARSYTARGYGRHRIKRELRLRIDDENAVETALDELPEAEESIDTVIARLAGVRGLHDEKQRRRVSNALYRRGFDWEDIRAGLDRAESGEDEE